MQIWDPDRVAYILQRSPSRQSQEVQKTHHGLVEGHRHTRCLQRSHHAAGRSAGLAVISCPPMSLLCAPKIINIKGKPIQATTYYNPLANQNLSKILRYDYLSPYAFGTTPPLCHDGIWIASNTQALHLESQWVPGVQFSHCLGFLFWRTQVDAHAHHGRILTGHCSFSDRMPSGEWQRDFSYEVIQLHVVQYPSISIQNQHHTLMITHDFNRKKTGLVAITLSH